MTPSSRPTWVKAASAVVSCSRVSAADICVRMRAWPLGTTGKEKPMTYTPCASRRSAMLDGEGGIAEHHRDDRVLAGLRSKPAAAEPRAEEARVLEQLRAQRGELSSRSSTAMLAAATTGGMLLEKR